MKITELKKSETERRRAEEIPCESEAHDELETRVQERTAELARANEALQAEIAERKHAERRLRLLCEAVEEAPDGIQIVDLDGRIIFSNKAVEVIYGFSSDEFKGKHINEINVDPEVASKVIIPSIKETGRWVGEIMVKHKDGRTFPIWLNASIIKDKKGEPLAMVGIIQDITERRRAEEALKNYAVKLEEANRLKDLFTDIIRHDLLNPAGIIKTMTELKLEETKDEGMRNALIMIKRNADKLIDMITSASKYAKLESADKLERKLLDLNEVLRTAADSFATQIKEKNMKLEYLTEGKCCAMVNPIIEDAFSNLISNAVKYSPEGRKIEVNISDENGYCTIYVKDWGHGIKGEDKKKIFTRFQRVNKKGVRGTGLGLAIVRRIVDLHGGRVWVEDNPEGGCVFYVKIPKTSGSE
jgi:PAS domain S-box-containing protein